MMARYPMAMLAALALIVAMSLSPAKAMGDDEDDRSAVASITAGEMKDHVDYFADDKLLGRRAGSPGGREAAEYIAKQFAIYGIEPFADGDYFQELGRNDKMRNVVGVLRGSDPELRDEYVVLGAHYDHVGQGRRGGGRMGARGDDDIYNGADDNASGTSGVLEIAQAFSMLETPPKRSIVFILFDAEERGLWGSSHYVEEPLFPLEDTVAMVNLDMIGRSGKGKAVELYGALTGEGLEDLVAACNESVDVNYTVKKNMMYNSDHVGFVRRGIPVLFFFTGLHRDYHRPSDHADKIDHGGMEKISRLTYLIVQGLADGEGRPAFKAPPAPRPRPRRRILGVRGMEVDGKYKIERIYAGRPAFRAGLKRGDILLELRGEKIKDRDSLIRVLRKVKKDDTVEARILRDGEEMTLQVPFGPKKKKRGWY